MFEYYFFLIFRKAEIQMGRTYMRVYAILFGTLIGFTTYFYTIQDMKAKMQTEAVQLEYIGGAPGGFKGKKAKNLMGYRHSEVIKCI